MTKPWTGSIASVSLVWTAMTPGIASASAVSSAEIRAWGIVDRTNARCAVPAGVRSSKYLASPRRMRGSSTRRTGFPRIEPEATMAGLYRGAG